MFCLTQSVLHTLLFIYDPRSSPPPPKPTHAFGSSPSRYPWVGSTHSYCPYCSYLLSPSKHRLPFHTAGILPLFLYFSFSLSRPLSLLSINRLCLSVLEADPSLSDK
ncbi:uncharacterized protein BO97DRAFT_178915 [Aspergillus homomorphus CBS 101889]|uniref:Uncharacterized protein n=1 Tax=Aspergillus homomorphus (strain CBS 101889) TaxID=1450537 RepID=A0A395I9V6_ASPHC|nr:hypothetical protein BO97DRAFT_178915 [Aspergillus homomorphus CBS 101889]RAL15993.1 hypothetical protein BO97DRAFT_178915 [Aspergillus homomorphus CBS 101889]